MPRRSSSSSASPSSSASTARRCSPCEPNVRRSRPAERTPRSSRCGPAPGRAALEIAVEPPLELLDARRPRPRSAARPAAGPARRPARRSAGRSAATVSCRPATSSAASSLDLLVPRRKRLPRGDALRDPPQRGVSLPDCGAVLGRETGPARRQPAEHAVEVRPARGGAALDHHQPVGREDERRHLAAQLLGRAQLRPVQRRSLAAAELERHLELERHAGPRAAQGDPRRLPRRSAPAARRPASAARTPACRRAATRAGSSCRRRSDRSRARGPARAPGPASSTSGSPSALPTTTISRPDESA